MLSNYEHVLHPIIAYSGAISSANVTVVLSQSPNVQSPSQDCPQSLFKSSRFPELIRQWKKGHTCRWKLTSKTCIPSGFELVTLRMENGCSASQVRNDGLNVHFEPCLGNATKILYCGYNTRRSVDPWVLSNILSRSMTHLRCWCSYGVWASGKICKLPLRCTSTGKQAWSRIFGS